MVKRHHLHRVAPEHAQMQQNAQAASEAMPAARAQVPDARQQTPALSMSIKLVHIINKHALRLTVARHSRSVVSNMWDLFSLSKYTHILND